MSATTTSKPGRQLGAKRLPSAAILVREYDGKPFFECKFRWRGSQIKRRVGPAWVEPDGAGGWKPSKRRMAEGHFNEAGAHIRAAELVAEYVSDFNAGAQRRAEARSKPVTFRDVAADYLRWLEVEYGAKAATLKDHRYMLAEPGTPHSRGAGTAAGRIMGVLGDLPASEVSTDQIRELLSKLTAKGMSARNVNKHRNLIGAIFAHGVKRGTRRLKLTHNPVVGIEARRETRPAPLVYFTPEEVEAIARALVAGAHRDPSRPAVSDDEREARAAVDSQDAEAVRLAAYTGLRRGELVGLRWRDVRWTDAKLVVSRAVSAGVEGAPKSGSFREVPLSDQAAAALERLSQRDRYMEPDDLVLCNVYGRELDPAALGRRYNRARDAAKLRPLRWHDLRHSFGSLLVAGGVDTVTVKAAMGHARITTTERYLHARPATQTAAAFTAAFRSSTAAGDREMDVVA